MDMKFIDPFEGIAGADGQARLPRTCEPTFRGTKSNTMVRPPTGSLQSPIVNSILVGVTGTRSR
jgi:hypothetical protein